MPEFSAFWQAVPLTKFQINLQHVDKLFPSQSAKRCRNIILQDLLDIFADISGIMLSVVSPLGGYPIRLIEPTIKRKHAPIEISPRRNSPGSQISSVIIV